MENSIFWKLAQATTLPSLWAAVDDEMADRDLVAPKDFPSGAERWVLYGAGRFGQSVLRAWALRGIAPDYCVDADPTKWGTLVQGVAVCRPEQLFAEASPVCVVIAAMTTYDIEQGLQQRGIPFLFAELDGTTSLISGHTLASRRNDFSHVYDRLADDASRIVFIEVAKAWMFQRYHSAMRGNIFTANIATSPQYFPYGVVRLESEERYVDCGTYDGDTIVEFFAQSKKAYSQGMVTALGVEVDSKNADWTRRTLRQYGLDQVEINHAGVGAKDGHERMSIFHTCITGTNTESAVPVRKLDSILEGWHPTYIKMDIEGSELDALAGASKVIAKDAPTLAVCTYHQTSHLIDIPRYLIDLDKDNSSVFLRHHSAGTLWETVCYRPRR